MSEPKTPLTPEPGDFVVVYQPTLDPAQPRVVLVRVSEDGTLRLVRSTFSPPEEAGPRFEDEARLIAAASGSRSLRCVDDRHALIGELPGDGQDDDDSSVA